MNTGKIQVSVIIPTYNRKEQLKKSIESLFHQTYPKNEYEIVIVGSSSDGTEEMIANIRNAPCELRYFREDKAKTSRIGAARNLGIKAAKGEVIAFMDDDCIASEDWLKNIDDYLKKNSDAAVIGYTESEIPPSRFIHSVINKEGRYITCNLAVRKEIFAKIGLFDPHFDYWFEDEDLCLRMIEHGKKIGICPQMRIKHPFKYQSILTYLKKRRVFWNYGYMNRKYPEKGYLKRTKVIFYRALKKIVYLFSLVLLPLPHTNFLIRVLFAFLILWVIDFYRLQKIKKNLSHYKIKLKIVDQISFTLLNWLVNLVEAYYLMVGILKYRALNSYPDGVGEGNR